MKLLPISSAALALTTLLAAPGCDTEHEPFPTYDASQDAAHPFVAHEGSVVPSRYFADADGNTPSADMSGDTPVYRAVPGGSGQTFALVDTDGSDLTWGEVRQAVGIVEITCTDFGTEISVDAEGLRPGGVYSAWLAVFDQDGFEAGGMNALLGLSPAGARDGSASSFVANTQGEGGFETTIESGRVTVPFVTSEVSVDPCLLDMSEVHVILSYHQDGQTCGGQLCETSTFVEQLSWMFVDGDPA